MGDRKQHGASFLDLLMVGVLIGILSALAIIQVKSSVQYYQLISEAEQIAAELHVARTMAVSRGAVVQISIDQQAKTLGIYDSDDLQNPLRYPVFLDDGISFSTIPSDPIVFSSRGVATGGTITLTGASGSISIQVDDSGKTQVSPMEPIQSH